MADVMTVLGYVPAERLGRVLPHEHLLSLLPGPWTTGGGEDESVELAVHALTRLKQLGFGCVVDLSPYGVVGRSEDGGNIALLREVSQASELHIVAGTALYLESYAPDWALEADVDQLTARFIDDAKTGIGGTEIRAGVFGEQATSLGVITPYEERVLRAVARAAIETGLSVMTHTTHGTMATEQVKLLRAEGLVPERIVIGHMDTQLSLATALAVLDTGVSIAIDTIGKQVWDFSLGPASGERPEGAYDKRAFFRSDRGRAEMVARLVDRGFVDRLLLSQDLTGAEVWMNPDTHGRHGYCYVGDRFLGMLAREGVSEVDIERMLTTNPARLLAVA